MEQSPGLGRLFNVDGNAPDPEGGDLRGVSPGYNMAAGALGSPVLFYPARDGTDTRCDADVFDAHVHLHCPICLHAGFEHGLMIHKGVAEWGYDPLTPAPTFPGWDTARTMITYPKGTGGRLSMKTVQCPWGKHKFSIANNVVKLG